MKKVYLVCLMISILGILVGCGNSDAISKESSSGDIKGKEVAEENVPLEGKWVSCDGYYSVLFDNDGKVLIDDEHTGKYSKYDSNKVAIDVNVDVNIEGYNYYDDISINAEYSINDGMLVLSDLNNDFKWYFFTEDKVGKYKNKKYSEGSYGVSFIDTNDIVGYAEKVSEGCLKAQSIVDKEVLPLYNKYSIYQIYWGSDNSKFETIPKAEFVYDGVKYYVIMVAPEGYIGGEVELYAVDLDTGNILKGQWDDEYHIIYRAWEGCAIGVSLTADVDGDAVYE